MKTLKINDVNGEIKKEISYKWGYISNKGLSLMGKDGKFHRVELGEGDIIHIDEIINL